MFSGCSRSVTASRAIWSDDRNMALSMNTTKCFMQCVIRNEVTTCLQSDCLGGAQVFRLDPVCQRGSKRFGGLGCWGAVANRLCCKRWEGGPLLQPQASCRDRIRLQVALGADADLHSLEILRSQLCSQEMQVNPASSAKFTCPGTLISSFSQTVPLCTLDAVMRSEN